MTENDEMAWGAHKGKKLKDVTPSYLLWIAQQSWMSKWPELAAYIAEHEEELKAKVAQ